MLPRSRKLQSGFVRLPAPDMVVVDGGRGAAAALAECWPDTKVQRCYFHIVDDA